MVKTLYSILHRSLDLTEYYPIETIVYGIKNIKQEFIENGRKEIYKRTYKD